MQFQYGMLSLPKPHLTTILLKAYLYQLLLPGTSCLVIKEKITRNSTRQKKICFEKIEQASESATAEMLELSE